MQNINPVYTKFHLDNGIKCILYPRNEVHSVTIQVNVNVGSLDEDEANNGYSHFIEHVVHDGTKGLPSWEAVDGFVNDHSGSTNAYTNIHHTQYYGTFPSQYLDQAVYYFSQIVFHPLFDQKEIDKEKDIILDEMKRYEDETEHKIMRLIKENRFDSLKSPYSYEIIGTADNIRNLKKESVLEYYRNHYLPRNVEIYVVGNMDVDTAKSILEKHFNSNLEPSAQTSKKREFKENFPLYSKNKINAAKKLDLDQYYLTVTFPSFEFKFKSEEERIKLDFLQTITASSSFFQSVLWKKLRQELGIVYGIQAWNYDMFSRSILGIQTSFQKEYLDKVLEEIRKGLEEIKSGKIDDSVFKAKKKKILDTQLMQLDSPINALSWISDYEDEIEENGKGMRLSEFLDFVEKLEFEEIIKVANEIYNFEAANIGVVSKEDSDDVVRHIDKVWGS